VSLQGIGLLVWIPDIVGQVRHHRAHAQPPPYRWPKPPAETAPKPPRWVFWTTAVGVSILAIGAALNAIY